MNYTAEISNSLNVLSEMFTDRGQDASELANLSQAEVQQFVSSRNIFSIPPLMEGSTLVVFDLSHKLKWADTVTYIEKEAGSLNDIKLIIVVVKEKANMKNVGKLKDVDQQSFALQDLQFNISKHILVPKHELIADDKEITEILTNYQLKSKTQLPLILNTDPMAKYFNAKPGNIMKITRISPTCGTSIVYRCVT